MNLLELNFLSKKTKLRLYGSDVSSNAVERANGNLKGRGIKVRLGDIINLQYKNKEFDQITALEVIEHVPDWERAVLEWFRERRWRWCLGGASWEKIRHRGRALHRCNREYWR